MSIDNNQQQIILRAHDEMPNITAQKPNSISRSYDIRMLFLRRHVLVAGYTRHIGARRDGRQSNRTADQLMAHLFSPSQISGASKEASVEWIMLKHVRVASMQRNMMLFVVNLYLEFLHTFLILRTSQYHEVRKYAAIAVNVRGNERMAAFEPDVAFAISFSASL